MAIFAIPVTKGKGTVEINTDLLPEEVLVEVYRLGLKELVNRGMSKITKAAFNDADAVKNGHANGEAHMRAEAMKIGETNVKKILEGDIKFSDASKAKKVSGVVMTEARRIAKALIKDQIKAAKQRISDYAAKDITAAAKALLEAEQGQAIIAAAEENIRKKDETKITGIDIMSMVKASPALVAKNAEKKRSAPLSATQAGKTKKRGAQAPTAQA